MQLARAYADELSRRGHEIEVRDLLFCASEGLATVFRASVDREALARTMRLDRPRFITCAQTVGYRKE